MATDSGRFEIEDRPVAQLAERRSPKPKVGGSIPSWPAGTLLKLTDGQFENSKFKVKSAKLWNPDFVGMAIFNLFLFCIIAYCASSYTIF